MAKSAYTVSLDKPGYVYMYNVGNNSVGSEKHT